MRCFSMVRPLVLVAFVAMAASLALRGSLVAFEIVPEYELKAAFLYQFLKFADWPSANPDSSLRIAVAGPEPVFSTFKTVLAGKSAKGRPIAVQRVDRIDRVPSCDLAFIAMTDAADVGRILDQLRQHPVLTVGEDRVFRDAGGMIEFHVVDQRVRIRINLDATDQAGVRLHPSLLTVADAVTRKGDVKAKKERLR